MITYETFIIKSKDWFKLGEDIVVSDLIKRYEIWLDQDECMYICQIWLNDYVVISKVNA